MNKHPTTRRWTARRTRLPLALATAAMLALATTARTQTSTSRGLFLRAQAQEYIIINVIPDTLTCPLDVTNLNQTVSCGTSNVSWTINCIYSSSFDVTESPPTPAQILCTGVPPSDQFQGGLVTGSANISCTAFHDPSLTGTYTKTITFDAACGL